jgi:predicted DNA-binding transcriptional regulator AlpA
MQHGASNRLLDALIARLGGRLIIRPQDSQDVFSWSPGTSHNMIARGELPPLRHFGGRTTGWLVAELIEHLAQAPPSRLSGPRSPGRPRKSARKTP